jgi:hypothetical protein
MMNQNCSVVCTKEQEHISSILPHRKGLGEPRNEYVCTFSFVFCRHLFESSTRIKENKPGVFKLDDLLIGQNKLTWMGVGANTRLSIRFGCSRNSLLLLTIYMVC